MDNLLIGRTVDILLTIVFRGGCNLNELHTRLSTPLRYALALAILLMALTLRLWAVPVESGLWFMTFYPAMIICIYLCGIEAGVLMAVLSAITVYYIFVPPYWTLSFSKKHIDAIFTFLLATSMIALIVKQLQSYADELRKSRDELENKVLERTADLQTANAALLVEKAHHEELIRKLAQAHSQLLQSEKMASIGQLAAGVAHEINNPIGFVNSNLGTLKLYVENLLMALSAYEKNEGEMTAETRAVLAALKQQIDLGYLREDVANLLSESMDGLQRVKRIVQDLKDFSHVDEAEKQSANLEQGLDSTLNVVWNELKYKAEVVKEYGGIPNIMCMPAQLNQVFMNLLMNAGQAIEDHGRITIRTGREGGNVWVEVEDTGKGIKPEHLERIFDPFFTTKPVGSGTGLGLSLSYGIVQKHGGHIEVKSEPGKGTVFRVVLPQHVVPTQQA